MPIKLEGEHLSEAFQEALRRFPEQREDMFERLGQQVLTQVRSGVGVYRTGKVQTWQEMYLGSKRYYTAVRPKAKTFHGKYAVGHITTAINSGHRIRYPSGKSKRYKTSFTQTKNKVPGKRFYDQSAELEALITAESEKLAEKIVASLEGNT